MKYLVDADVLSEPTKAAPQSQVMRWLRQHEIDLAVSAIVLGEIEYGILRLPAGRKRTRLHEWFQQRVVQLHTIDFDSQVATAWAKLLARLNKAGLGMPVKDSLIAATALAHGLTVATRNVTDYRHAGVRVVDPFR